MNLVAFIRICFIAVAFFLGVSDQVGAGQRNSADRPNLVVILCDDLGYGDLECYGHPHIKTPNLNQLAADGIRFTDFYSAAPVCSPSRVGLLTGRSPNRAGVFDWIPPAGAKPTKNARHQVHMRAQETTIPALLKSADYATCMAGKWHCNSRFNNPAQPQPGDFGFDHWLATQNNAAPSHQFPTNFVRNGTPIGKVESFSCNFVVDEASRWLKDHQANNPSQPFFIFLAFHEPHEPVASPPELVKQYQDVAKTADEAQYFANVANVDLAVGSLLKTLDQMNLAENTLVVFTSDNGPETLNRYRSANRSYGSPRPLRGMKLHTYEAGIRVAGIMRWPNKVKPGQVIRQPVSSLDFLPTFNELAEVEQPNRKLDGMSILPILNGEPATREQPLMWCYFNAINEARVAMRDGKWKVLAKLVDPETGKVIGKMQNLTSQQLKRVKQVELTDFELYDMSQDVSESNNLVASLPEIAASKQAILQRMFVELTEDSHVWQDKD